ncbi:hypothetical protein AB0H51_27870 [Streptomyces griseoluteus]|uniref:hypothetical protein n=1 Tax=Streptomyces griseoluteus TaxID=29306 RepID=UPI0033EAB43D
MADGRISARISEQLAAWLADRSERMMTGSTDLQAKLELDMWRAALDSELNRIRLTVEQANCLADVLNSTTLDAALAGRAGIVYYNASDAFALARDTPVPETSSYGAKHGIDETALLDYLRRLGPTADHALHDAIARWWATDAQPTAEGWRSVGLNVVEPREGA